MPTVSSHIHLFRISNINQAWFRTCQDKHNTELKKQIWENSVEQKIYQIQHITSRNDKTEYSGWKYEKKVVLQPVCISDDFEFREPEFYKLVTTVTCDYDIQNIYTIPIGR